MPPLKKFVFVHEGFSNVQLSIEAYDLHHAYLLLSSAGVNYEDFKLI